jgi:hypothetical protein
VLHAHNERSLNTDKVGKCSPLIYNIALPIESRIFSGNRLSLLVIKLCKKERLLTPASKSLQVVQLLNYLERYKELPVPFHVISNGILLQ